MGILSISRLQPTILEMIAGVEQRRASGRVVHCHRIGEVIDMHMRRHADCWQHETRPTTFLGCTGHRTRSRQASSSVNLAVIGGFALSGRNSAYVPALILVIDRISKH